VAQRDRRQGCGDRTRYRDRRIDDGTVRQDLRLGAHPVHELVCRELPQEVVDAIRGIIDVLT